MLVQYMPISHLGRNSVVGAARIGKRAIPARLPGVPRDGLAAAALALLSAADPAPGRPLARVVLLGEVGVVAHEVPQQRQPLVPLRLRLGLDVQEVVAAPAAPALLSVRRATIFLYTPFNLARIVL